MKSKEMADVGVYIELDANDMAPTVDEIEKEAKGIMTDLENQKNELDDIQEPALQIVDVAGTEARNAEALEILAKEKQMQEEREKEWKKEKRSKRIKRFIATAFWVIIATILLLAFVGGYRIPIPQEWVNHLQNIYQTAHDVVVGYFAK